MNEPDCRHCGAALKEKEEGGWLHAGPSPSCEEPFPATRWLALSVAAESREMQRDLVQFGDRLENEEFRWILANAMLSITILSELVADLLAEIPDNQVKYIQPALAEFAQPAAEAAPDEGGNDEVKE